MTSNPKFFSKDESSFFHQEMSQDQIAKLINLANHGIKEAQYALARCYEKGNGVKKSAQDALYYYKLSAENGYDFALHRLGDAYLHDELGLKKDPEIAVHYYQLAINNGSKPSLASLAECYEKGEGVEKSSEQAFYYYNLAAQYDVQVGNDTSIFKLAQCFQDGLGTERSFEKAAFYYQLAAKNGHPLANYLAGMCYKELSGNENIKKAIECFRKAEDEQYPEAFRQLSLAYATGYGVEKSLTESERYHHLYMRKLSSFIDDNKLSEEQIRKTIEIIKNNEDYANEGSLFAIAGAYDLGLYGLKKNENMAFHYYKAAADRGYVHAFYQTGYHYLWGVGTEISYKDAFEYLSMAVKSKDSQAFPLLAYMFQIGAGCNQSNKKALELLKQGVELLDSESMYEMGKCYEYGYGVEKSNTEAIKYYKLAADQGHPEARCNLYMLCQLIGDQEEILNEIEKKYFKSPSNGNDLMGICNLGKCYELGIGTTKSLYAAFQTYLGMAGKEFPQALYEVGRCYFYGIGTEKSYEKALKYFNLALDKGYVREKIHEKIKYCERRRNYKKHSFTNLKENFSDSQEMHVLQKIHLDSSNDNLKKIDIYDKHLFKPLRKPPTSKNENL